MRLLDINRQDTICAVSTPLLPAALSIIRVSGPGSLTIKEAIFFPLKGQQKFFVATRGNIQINHKVIDDAICLSFPEGKSYTGEPSFELSLHGNPLLAQTVLKGLVDLGCRIAEPGEFTLRAVLSGKIDLTQAEAVHDLIHARSNEAAQAALKNLHGGLQKHLEPARTQIIDALCEIEARLDFPDEDLGDTDYTHLIKGLQATHETLLKLLSSAQLGQRLMTGARIILFGQPNAGKSTLMNMLVGEEKALVHHLPGTTRDVIESTWNVKGVPVTLVDVAGIRSDNNIDPVEAMGIKKAHQELEKADLILYLHPCTEDKPPEMPDFLQQRNNVLVIPTKADLAKAQLPPHAISAHTGLGLSELKSQIHHLLVHQGPSQDEVLLTKERQKEEVLLAQEAVHAAISAIYISEAAEIIAAELRSAGKALDRLLGKELNEDVLDLIFSRFCIGK